MKRTSNQTLVDTARKRTAPEAGSRRLQSGNTGKEEMDKVASCIGSRRELFCDPYRIERFAGASLRLHPPQPQEISVSFDASWEGMAPGYCTIFQDDSCCRMIYRIMPPGGCEDRDPRQMTAYAESTDGIHWVKPALGLFEVDGSTANNVIWRGNLSHNFTPFVDTNPACPPDERYKAVGGTKIEWGGEGLWLLVSHDCLHWRRRDKAPIAFPGHFDSQNLLFWDADAGCYRAYWRGGHPDQQRPGRDVLRATSVDLASWNEARPLLYDPGRSGSPERDQTDDPSGDHHQFYSNGVLPYPRAPHMILGFPQRYCDRGWTVSTGLLPDPGHRRRQADLGIGGGRPTRKGTAVTDLLFMASRDGNGFYVWPEAIVRPGIQRPGSWYYGGAWFAWGMLRTPSPFPGAPDEFSIYIQERFAPDTPGRLRRHTFRMDGFGSLYAPLTGGRAVTKPLTFDGDQLSINFSTSGGGQLRIGFQDAGGADIAGFRLDDCDLQYGDQIDRVVTWQGNPDVGMLAGRQVRLQIELKDADLFSFRFRHGFDE